jgi:predicted ATP-binding protein involved in virulence
MRIEKLTLQNYKKFEHLVLELHPHFNLLVGSNGSGKTTILDALAMCISLWDVSIGAIPHKDRRLVPIRIADRIQFQEMLPVSVKASGFISPEHRLEWGRSIDKSGRLETSAEALELVKQLRKGNEVNNWPIIAYYGVNRAALSEQETERGNFYMSLDAPRREDGYTYWLNRRINYDELRRWFYRETAAAGENNGRKRPGFEVVRQAVMGCLPESTDLSFSVDRTDLISSINGQTQPLSNLSDGQRMMLAMVADIAIKTVTLNAHLLPTDKLGTEDQPLPRVLKETPGVVLIDELDLHLHPSWQRRVAADLKRTFPSIQFIATTHSPQIIGEVPPDEIRIIDEDRVYSPDRSYGMDASSVLEEVMGTTSRPAPIAELLATLSRQISDDHYEQARETIKKISAFLGEDDPEILRANTLMEFVGQDA